MSEQTAGKRVDHLDGIRALAITAVLAVHWGSSYLPYGLGGTTGVDMFFVLSGFIITTLLWDWRGQGGVGQQYADFLRRRVRRLYPALVGLCVVTPLVWLGLSQPPFPIGSVVERAGLSLAQLTWLPESLGHTMDPFRQTWSLAIEWYFYLLWAPLLLWLRRRASAAAVLRVIVPVAVALYAVPALTADIQWFYFAPPARFGELLAGASLALAVAARPGLMQRRPTPDWLVALLVVALGVFVLLAPHPSDSGMIRWLGSPLAVVTALALIWHGYSRSDGPVLALLRSGPVTLLGRVSYSLYLWHWLPIYVLDKDLLPLPTLAVGAIGVAAAAGLTALSYLVLERPFTSSRSDALSRSAVELAR